MKCVKRKPDYSKVLDTLFWHALYGVAMGAWYRLYLFRCFAKLSLVDSRVAGYYDDSEHLILINVDYLMTASGHDVCNTVIHEAYHALEHRMVDAYLAAPDDMKNLEIYRDAAVYKREFDNYQECSGEDFLAYSNQLCEKHASFWADLFTYDIQYAVNEHYGIHIPMN